MKFTGQAKSCCSICGSGDHYPCGCSLSVLRPNNTHQGLFNNYNRGTKCSQAPCPFSHRCKTCYGDHPAYRHDDPPLKKLEARLIRNQQITEALLSMKPQTPVNIPLLTDLLKIHPNQNFAANLTAGLAQGFFGSATKATASLKQLKTFLQPINIPFSLKKTSWQKLNLAALQALSNPPPPPSQTFRSIPLGWFQKRIAKKWRTIFHLPSPKGSP